MHQPWNRFWVRVLACFLVLMVACAEAPVRPPPVLPPLGRIGILPVEIPPAISVHDPGFGEGFRQWSMADNPPQTSNTAGDIVLLAAYLISILTGIAGGVVAEVKKPSDHEIEECTRNLQALCQRINLAEVVREEIARTIDVASMRGGGSGRDASRAVYLDEIGESELLDSGAVLSVRIREVRVVAPEETDQRGPIILVAYVEVHFPSTGNKRTGTLTSDLGRREELDWMALESGKTERFNESAEEFIRLAVTSLGWEVVHFLSVAAAVED